MAAEIPPPKMTHAQANALLTAAGSPFETEDIVVRGIKMKIFKHAPKTLVEMYKAGLAVAKPESDYLVLYDENGRPADRLTWRQSSEIIAAFGHFMRNELGVKKGDRIALALRNWPEWILAFWAAQTLGAIVTPLNGWFTGPELSYCLENSGTSLLIADGERYERLIPELDALRKGNLRNIVVTRPVGGKKYQGTVAWADAVAAGRRIGTSLPETDIHPDDSCSIFYTSGTTGKPKGAEGTNRNWCQLLLVSNFQGARQLVRQGEPLPEPDPNAIQRAILISVPLFHATGYAFMQATTFQGGKVVLMYKWDPETGLRILQDEKITAAGGVPSMVWQMMEHPNSDKYDISTVEGWTYGGAPSAPELRHAVAKRSPKALSMNGYGMTETTAGVITNVLYDYARKPDSIGYPVVTCEVKITDPENFSKEMPRGQIGEICMRGPQIIKSYWNNPEATTKSIVDGYMRSGDLGYMDNEGFVYIRDRAKDMLIRSGENIYCIEVEDALYSHPAVMEAAVIGLPDRISGEEVGAVIQVKPGMKTTPEELIAHCKGKIAPFKVPIFVQIRETELPKNPNGKPMKSILKTEVIPVYEQSKSAPKAKL
ncbi:AMP-dependent synthetase and ligase [Hyaloraphidium curvatum]|nr:AMP-dependent synthetase and ligase [Hyaloraphidium curvatum]